MEKFWIQLLALLTLLTQTGSASDTPELIGAVGGFVTFRSPSTDGNGALWSFGDDPILTVPFKGPQQPVFLKEEYKTRFTVSERGRALSISQLRMEDAGTYSVTIDGKISTFTLLVYRELRKPTVTCEAQDCLDNICLFSLRCSVNDTGFGNVSYTWTGWGQQWEERPVVLAVVDKSSLDELEPLRCTARNAVSSRSVTVTTPEGLCSENSVDPPGPDTFLWSSFWIGVVVGVTVGVAVVVVILLGFYIFFCKSQGYWQACKAHRARLASGSSESSATARPVHRGSPEAMRLLAPAPGLPSDQHRPESGWSISAPAQTTNQLRPEPGLVLDRSRPGSGWALDMSRPEPGLVLNRSRPGSGWALDSSRPGSGWALDMSRPEPGLVLDRSRPGSGWNLDSSRPGSGWTFSEPAWNIG